MTERLLPDPSLRLAAAFRAIHAGRMQGLPLVNPNVRVEAIGFMPWKHYWLGVMLTPWAMNFVLTPRDPVAFRPLPAGEKRRCLFPAGAFDFVSARDETIGDYFACSLFSPVHMFADHETARETAWLALAALLDAAHAEVDEAQQGERKPLADLSAPITRRDLLRGRIKERGDDARR